MFASRFSRHSAVNDLKSRLFCHGSFDEIVSRIDRELEDPDRLILGTLPTVTFSPQPNALFLTKYWLIRLRPGGGAVLFVPDLAWIYPRLVARSRLLTADQIRDELVCVTRTGDCVIINVWSQRRKEQIAEAILERRPELLTGYRGEWIDLAACPDEMWTEVTRRRDKVAELSQGLFDEWLADRVNDCRRYIRRDKR